MTHLDRIFEQLHSPATWPAVPERPVVPATLDDLAAMTFTGDLVCVDPVPWTPPATEAEG